MPPFGYHYHCPPIWTCPPTHNFLKLCQLQAYNSLYNYDFICISETYLDSTVTHNNKNIRLDMYSFIRLDHLSNSKKGGVYLYYKESLGVKVINLSASNECILCDLSIENCKGFIAVMYRSPSQNTNLKTSYLHLGI